MGNVLGFGEEFDIRAHGQHSRNNDIGVSSSSVF